MTQDLFQECLDNAVRSAVHLEMRDAYMLDDPTFKAWQAGDGGQAALKDYAPWGDVVRTAVARGVVMRRARLVSEPISDYIRFEYDITEALNVAAGEQVRWLARRSATDISVVPVDFWVFDDSVALFNHFAGDGSWPEPRMERRTEPSMVKACVESFEAVWGKATPHSAYKPA